MVFLVTFNCYGKHLPGDAKGSWDHVRRGEHRWIPPNPGLENHRHNLMRQPEYILCTPEKRALVRDAIFEVCRFRCWSLYALHVRPSHVHGLVEADVSPAQIVNAWKAYATRALRSGMEPQDRIIWAHGANCSPVRSQQAMRNAMRYVLDGQGERMEWFCSDDLRCTPA